jgi:hypothetical protein
LPENVENKGITRLFLIRFAVFTGILHMPLKIKQIVGKFLMLNEAFNGSIYKFGMTNKVFKPDRFWKPVWFGVWFRKTRFPQ